MEKSFTKMIDGENAKVNELIERGRKWYEKCIDNGYKETPFGLLPMSEIKKAGFVWNSEEQEIWDYDKKCFVKQALGYIGVPSEDFISDGVLGTRKAGEKYEGVSRKFVYWLNDYNKRKEAAKTIEAKIENESKQSWMNLDKKIPVIATEVKDPNLILDIIDENGDIDISKIPF